MHRTIRPRWSDLWVASAGLALLALLCLSLPPVSETRGAPLAGAVVFEAAGANPAAIQATVDAYRIALGPLNPNQPGSVGSGRREINWDGVPDASAAPNNLAANFFNVNSPRGVIFSTPGSGFQVSANASVPPVRFGNINANYPTIFQTFSAQRLFTALGSNIVDVTFFVPGSTTPATVSGFGAVFTDVDTANVTSIQYFDANDIFLSTRNVLTSAGSQGLSFQGVLFNAGERVGRVRITSGNAPLGPNDAPPGTEIVVMDDFIYGEPIGQPPTLTPTPTATATATVTPTATITPTPTPTAAPCILGDINCDGIVDIRDYGIWRLSFGASNCGNSADLNGECIVDIRDYGVWRQNFGHTAGTAVVAAAASPGGTPTPVPGRIPVGSRE